MANVTQFLGNRLYTPPGHATCVPFANGCFTPGESAAVPIVQEAGRAAQPVWTSAPAQVAGG
jgi:hypothetical protein